MVEKRRILTLEEVAERTRIPVSTLRYWRYHGERGPTTFLLGRRIVAYEADVDAWIAAQYEEQQRGER